MMNKFLQSLLERFLLFVFIYFYIYIFSCSRTDICSFCVFSTYSPYTAHPSCIATPHPSFFTVFLCLYLLCISRQLLLPFCLCLRSFKHYFNDLSIIDFPLAKKE